MFKKRLCPLCVALVMCTVPSFVFAGESITSVHSNIITVQWVSTSTADCSLSISSGQAISNIDLICSNSNMNSANFNMNLQQYKSGKWVTIKNWNTTESVEYLNANFEKSYSIQKGYSYRFKGTIKIYKDSTLAETISVTSSTKSY